MKSVFVADIRENQPVDSLFLVTAKNHGVTKGGNGYLTLRLLDRSGGEPPPFEEMKEKVRADYLEGEMERAFKQFLATLREKSVIEIKL